MLDSNTFKTVVDSTPLVSIDLIIINNNDEILLGKRKNKPAQGFYFTIGGRVYKNESMIVAANRILDEELGLKLKCELTFIGIFEHFYEDSIFSNTSTHYVNMAYKINLNDADLNSLSTTQHSKYKWASLSDLMSDSNVHSNVKAYFEKDKNRARIQKLTI
jgi:colanic acid biosynthesis protein WcaH